MKTTKSIKGTWPDGGLWEFVTADTLPSIPAVAVCGLLVQDGKILLTKNHRGWDFTGGHIELGESINEALVREMYEEGGVIVSDSRMLGYWLVKHLTGTINKVTGISHPSPSIIPFFQIYTDCHLEPVQCEDCLEAKWFAFDSQEITDFRYAELFEYLRVLLSPGDLSKSID